MKSRLVPDTKAQRARAISCICEKSEKLLRTDKRTLILFNFVLHYCRTIVLPATAFDSRMKFLQELRKSFGSAILNLGGTITTSTIADYYAFLKDDVSNDCKFYRANHLGYQGDDYWLLSSEVTF